MRAISIAQRATVEQKEAIPSFFTLRLHVSIQLLLHQIYLRIISILHSDDSLLPLYPPLLLTSTHHFFRVSELLLAFLLCGPFIFSIFCPFSYVNT